MRGFVFAVFLTLLVAGAGCTSSKPGGSEEEYRIVFETSSMEMSTSMERFFAAVLSVENGNESYDSAAKLLDAERPRIQTIADALNGTSPPSNWKRAHNFLLEALRDYQIAVGHASTCFKLREDDSCDRALDFLESARAAVSAATNAVPPPVTQTGTVEPGQHYLDDPADPQLPAVYDLLHADFVELNGSVVLRLEMRDVNQFDAIPRVVAALSVEGKESSYSYFVRAMPDLEKAAPHIRWEMGRIEGGKERVQGDICTILKTVEAPYYVFLELLDNRTELGAGGRITKLHVDIGSFENDTVLDRADSLRTFQVRPRSNTHGEVCPLVAERPQ